MPWETKFNIEETLEKALKAFWKYGYNATSMRDLSKCMGLNAGSIYSTFGNKRELYLSAMEFYNKATEKQLLKFTKLNSSKKGIISFFEHIRDVILDGSDKDGCFIINTTLEMAPHDVEMNKLVTNAQDVMRHFFMTMVKKGQEQGEISTQLNANDAGELFLSLLTGLRVITRTNPTKHQFDVVIKNVKLIMNT